MKNLNIIISLTLILLASGCSTAAFFFNRFCLAKHSLTNGNSDDPSHHKASHCVYVHIHRNPYNKNPTNH